MSTLRDPRPARQRRDRRRLQGDPQRRRPHGDVRARPTPSWAPTARASRRWPTPSPGTPSTRSPRARVTLDGAGRAGDDRRRAGPRRAASSRCSTPSRCPASRCPTSCAPRRPPCAARRRSCGCGSRRCKGAMDDLAIDPAFAERNVNEGFSGGERKRAEILQLELLNPKIAILDETDSGLDVDALRVVSEGDQPRPRDRRRRRPADHPLHPDPALRAARLRPRLRRRAHRRPRVARSWPTRSRPTATSAYTAAAASA